MIKLNSREMRNIPEQDVSTVLIKVVRRPFYLILDNINDTYNIGGLFRLADALAMEKIILCGVTEKPPNTKIKKSSIGTFNVVPWEYFENTVDAVASLKGVKICSIEQDERAIPYTDLEHDDSPIALIVGNETNGVSKQVLDMSNNILNIPMYGVGVSLNVITAAAIVAYSINKN
jgi:23S rRNA (guanosine2251-2'-O)-methyltransferase